MAPYLIRREDYTLRIFWLTPEGAQSFASPTTKVTRLSPADVPKL